MTEEQRRKRNAQKLQELNPAFRLCIEKVIADLEANSFRPRLQCAYRSPADQLEAYRRGASHVTFSFHNCTTPDGKPDSIAADFVDEVAPLAMPLQFSLALTYFARQAGLTTGGYFGFNKFQRQALDKASDNWKTPDPSVTISWDRGHTEPVGITLTEALHGKRPKMGA